MQKKTNLLAQTNSDVHVIPVSFEPNKTSVYMESNYFEACHLYFIALRYASYFLHKLSVTNTVN